MNKFSAQHIPVLKDEVLKYALPIGGETFADVTFGLGGHTIALLNKFSTLKKCLAIDKDDEILNCSCEICPDERIKRIQANASDLKAILNIEGIKGVDGILMDMGVSSYQLDNAERGFSFMRSGPLDMRMNKGTNTTAEELVNSLEKNELVDIFRKYGEEKFSNRIACAIIAFRRSKAITTTDCLAKIVSDAIPAKFKHKKKTNPATKVFQALRIAVNNELKELENFLEIALDCLNPGGHLTLISFHSLEDRIVKYFFNKHKKGCDCPPKFPVCICNKKPKIRLLTRKPVIASEKEIEENPRSRSAKLRSAVKLSYGENE